MTLASSNEKNTGPTPGPWMIVPPGGPQGPFYGLMNSQGNVVATQIVGEANARLMAQSPRLLKAAKDLWHADAAEGSDRDGMRIVNAWAELIDAIEAADGSRPLDPDEPTVEDVKARVA